jgi:hypothetical protein
MSRVFIAVIGLTAAARLAGAQAVLENDQMRLEVIGLKRWTVPMIQDSLRRHAPNDSLMSHACAAVLREKLKFADAAVVYRTMVVDGVPARKPFLAVTVIEPQDSALVRYRPPFRDSLRTRPAWAAVSRTFKEHNEAFQRAIQRPGFLSSTAPLTASDSALRAVLPLRRFVRAHAAPSDRRLALATLASDGSVSNRLAAVVLLSSFAQYGSTWWALADALRDPDAIVSATAAQVLSGMSRAEPGVVNWAPAAATLRALLDGTNLFAHDQIMEVLVLTRVDPALARALLGDGGGALVLAKLGAEDVVAQQGAHRFLVQMAGRDLGNEPARWRRWMAALSDYSLIAPGWDSTGAPGLRGSVNQRLVLPAGRPFSITLQTIGPGAYASPPAVSSSAVRFLDVGQASIRVPAGPTQVFRFKAVKPGWAVIVFRHDASNKMVEDTVVVR